MNSFAMTGKFGLHRLNGLSPSYLRLNSRPLIGESNGGSSDRQTHLRLTQSQAQQFSLYARCNQLSTSSSTSFGDVRRIRRRMVSSILEGRNRPPGACPSRRRPRSTRVFVEGCTRAKVRRAVSSDTYVLRACNVTFPMRQAAVLT